MSLAQVRIVLVRPQGPANVGAVARAMKNMGLAELYLVAPATLDDGWAEAMAVHARDVLAAARTVPSLPEALVGCARVIGTTARSGPYRAEPKAPRSLAPELAAWARQAPIAIVFGPEDHGLSNDDLKVCDDFVCIPTSSAYSSLNLAQAVLILCYELFLAAAEGRDEPVQVDEVADAGLVGFVLERLQGALATIGFLNPENPDHIMYTFRRLLGRARLRQHEAKVLLGMARQIEWYGKHGQGQ